MYKYPFTLLISKRSTGDYYPDSAEVLKTSVSYIRCPSKHPLIQTKVSTEHPCVLSSRMLPELLWCTYLAELGFEQALLNALFVVLTQFQQRVQCRSGHTDTGHHRLQGDWRKTARVEGVYKETTGLVC